MDRGEDGDKNTSKRKNWKQQALNTTEGRWRQQPKIELDGAEWSVLCSLS